ncbi:MAG: sugar phosphate isomerase/epimerase [Kiritimatiellae bacterium]|nr:sugar phosphate isomerase/epimerase [Kiritimatiellia bacterium]
MKLIVFSKSFKQDGITELMARAHDWGFDGYDLAVRPGYVVNPDNAAEQLPNLVAAFRKEGLSVPMVTGNFDLLEPTHPTAAPILSAMDKADVRLIKLGYFKFKPADQPDYWAEVDRIRRIFEAWQETSRRYNVKICYHTHSHYCMGLNCAALMHLLQGFDPGCLGAYIDAGHMAVEGEAFDVGLAMVKAYLSIVAVKDVMQLREENGDQGLAKRVWTEAGKGFVDWDLVFAELARVGFAGPVSIHAEYKMPTPEAFLESAKREVAYFRAKRDKALA